MHIDTQALINWLRADSAWQHAIAVRDQAECEIEARANEYMRVAKEVNANANIQSIVYFDKKGPGHAALAMLSSVKDEEIKRALNDHVTKQVESGENVTQKEFKALLKQLKEAQAEAGKAFCRAIGLDPSPFFEIECNASEVRVFAHGRRYTISLNGEVTIEEVQP